MSEPLTAEELLRRWRDAALGDDLSALADLTSTTTEYLDAARDRPGLDVERLARCLVIEGYPWEEQQPPGWRNRAEAERIATQYAAEAQQREGAGEDG